MKVLDLPNEKLLKNEVKNKRTMYLNPKNIYDSYQLFDLRKPSLDDKPVAYFPRAISHQNVEDDFLEHFAKPKDF